MRSTTKPNNISIAPKGPKAKDKALEEALRRFFIALSPSIANIAGY
jgi:hypothetical protein